MGQSKQGSVFFCANHSLFVCVVFIGCIKSIYTIMTTPCLGKKTKTITLMLKRAAIDMVKEFFLRL